MTATVSRYARPEIIRGQRCALAPMCSTALASPAGQGKSRPTERPGKPRYGGRDRVRTCDLVVVTTWCAIEVGTCWPGRSRLVVVSGGLPGRRPARRWPGGSRRSGPAARSSAATPATAYARRWRARRRSAGRTAACGPAARLQAPRVARPWPAWSAARGPDRQCLGQTPVAGIDRGVDGVVSPQQLLDPLGLDRRLVVHPTWPHRPGP